MTSTPRSTPSRFGLTARLAATVAVAAGATLGALLVRSTPASAVDHAAPTPGPSSPVTGAMARARQLLDGFTAPPGASRLPSAPADAPTAATTPRSTPPYRVVQTGWWLATQPAGSLISWVDGHPEHGFTPVVSDTRYLSVPTVDFSGHAKDAALPPPALTVAAYSLPNGSTVLRVDAAVGYVPGRPTSEELPAATQLIVVPTFSLNSRQTAAQVTVGNENQITEIEQVIDSLPRAPAGLISCPMDDGAGLALVFESAENTTLADVVVGVSGCRHVQVSISGYNEPALNDGASAAARIQGILATHWDLAQTSN